MHHSVIDFGKEAERSIRLGMFNIDSKNLVLPTLFTRAPILVTIVALKVLMGAVTRMTDRVHSTSRRER